MLCKCLIYKEKHDMGSTHTTLPGHTENGPMGLRGAFLGRSQHQRSEMNETHLGGRGGVPLA